MLREERGDMQQARYRREDIQNFCKKTWTQDASCNMKPLQGEAQQHNHFQNLFLISIKEHNISVTDK